MDPIGEILQLSRVDKNQSRTIHSTEDYATLRQGGFFLPSVKFMLYMEQSFSHSLRRSKEMFRETPAWFLIFKDKNYNNSRSFLHRSLTSMAVIPKDCGKNFHSETGVVSKFLMDYLKSVEEPDHVLNFITNFRLYITGDKKRMPRNVSGDEASYDFLKELLSTDYTRRLIDEYRDKSLSSSNRTQDFTLLFRIPLYNLVETVFSTLDDDDIVQTIEEYRT